MLPTHHLASAVLAGAALRAAGWSWPALASFAAGAVLIDVDHYLSYAWCTGDFSLWRAYRYHRARVPRPESVRLTFRWRLPPLVERGRPLHMPPALAGLALAAARVPRLRPLALGVALHRVLDYLWESCWAAQPNAKGRTVA